jgi:uncharacterized repeat protein (TIGR03803 family)
VESRISGSYSRRARVVALALAVWLSPSLFSTELAQGQTFVLLHTFGLSPDGARPWASLTRDASGNLYGTTQYGGSYSFGTVFELDPSGNETILHSFNGTDGAYLTSSVVRDEAGNTYGTTVEGGTCLCGTVFKLDATGNATVLHTFDDPLGGRYPWAGLVPDPAGSLYGTTLGGGVFGLGTIFKITPTGYFRVVHSFDGFDGDGSYGALARDAAGNLYGTSPMGGASRNGSVFRMNTAGKGRLLHSFNGAPDGASPRSRLIVDDVGNLYGTTIDGGANGYGIVFKLDSLGNETVLYSFAGGRDGRYPYGGLARDPAGNLYGTTQGDGFSSLGTVFELTPTGRLRVLHTFKGSVDGSTPLGDLIRDATGNLYGTTWGGGTFDFGTVFKITP